MVSLGFEPETGEWQVQTNPLSYGGPQSLEYFSLGAIFAKTNILRNIFVLLLTHRQTDFIGSRFCDTKQN